MRRVIVENNDRPAATSRAAPSPRAWWQECNVEEFKQRCGSMERLALQDLMSEIKGAVAVTSVVVQDTLREHEQRRRARIALGYMTEKRRLLTVILGKYVHETARTPEDKEERRDERLAARRKLVAEAREANARGDTVGAVERILDALDWMYY